MINRILLFSCLLTSTLIFGQANFNPTTKLFLAEHQALQKKSIDSKDFKRFIQEYDLIKKEGEYYIGVLALVDESKVDEIYLEELKVINDSRLNRLWTFRVPISQFNAFLQAQGLEYVEVGEPVSPDLERARPSARVDSVHAGLGELSRAYKGKGVVIAVIDWGFDYTHPNFYDSLLNEYRVVRAWDQNKFIGTPPEGFSFGVEYNSKADLLAAGSDTNYVFGYGSHGTHVAGIAGGGGAGSHFIGAAPEAELIFISLRRDAASLTDAFNYVKNYAESVGKPFVVNMSFGSHLGPHDGSSLKNYAIDQLHGPGRIFVGSAGNNGRETDRFHLDKDFSLDPDDTLTTVVQFADMEDQFGQTLSMWGSANSDFSVSVLLTSAGANIHYQTPFYSSLDEPTFIDTLVVAAGDTLILRMLSVASSPLNNKPNIRMELKNTTGRVVVLKMASKNSHVHIWNNVRMNNRYTNWGVPLTDNFVGAVQGDNTFGLGEPAGVGKNVITVGSYKPRFVRPSGVIEHGRLSPFSSKGPTVDMRTKPDIASTGQDVVSSVNSFNINESGPSGYSIEFEGRTYFWRSSSGTSMSGPMVAGIVALMLEANPELTAVQAKQIIRTTARLDEFTGEIGPEGTLDWGWGKANALAAVRAVETLSLHDIQLKEDIFNLYPNPANGMVHIELNTTSNKFIETVELIQVDGKHSEVITVQNKDKLSLSTQDLPAGIYLVKVQTAEAFSMKKLIVTK